MQSRTEVLLALWSIVETAAPFRSNSICIAETTNEDTSAVGATWPADPRLVLVNTETETRNILSGNALCTRLQLFLLYFTECAKCLQQNGSSTVYGDNFDVSFLTDTWPQYGPQTGILNPKRKFSSTAWQKHIQRRCCECHLERIEYYEPQDV